MHLPAARVPSNQEVLAQLIAKRHELATLLGYTSWAAYTTETKMTCTQQAAADFHRPAVDGYAGAGEEEFGELLARKKKRRPQREDAGAGTTTTMRTGCARSASASTFRRWCVPLLSTAA